LKKNEKRFWDILTNLFVGADIKGNSGFVSLMRAKSNYFKKVKQSIYNEIEVVTKDNHNFKDELYDKLYSFFHRYFSESGSIYYNYTPLFYNIYSKEYQNKVEQNYITDYEKVISNKQDVSLFYKTKMLYYVKSDVIFKDLEIEIDDFKYIFDVSNMQGKKANEKKELVYTLEKIEDKSLYFSVVYSQRGKKTKIADMLKECKKEKLSLKEDDFKKAFRVFEKQSNIDFFINKDAKKFLTEQLDMWIYQYMFSQESDFDIERFEQIKNIKKVALKLIDFISQFENELVKIWNKPRFVLNSNIVVTLDKLKEKGFDIEKLKSHSGYKAQQDEWRALGIIEDDCLIENDYLPIDTKYFKDLKDEIEELFSDDEIDGLLIKSENYQALNTILPRFRGKIDLIYIDPPFNTGSDFAYIDNFQDSTWLSLMENRLTIAKDILSKKGSFYLHLDDNADYMGRTLLNNTFGKENYRNNIIWTFGGKGLSNVTKKFSPYYGNIFFYTKNVDASYMNNKLNSIAKSVMQRFGKLMDKNFCVSFGTLKKYNELSEYEKAIKKFKKEFGKVPEDNDIAINYLENGTNIKDLWDDIPIIRQSSTYIESYGFNTQKPESLMQRIIQASAKEQSIILDYHLGSGTTIATAQKLNRKWLGIEMADHINTFYEDTISIKTTDLDKYKIVEIIDKGKVKSIVRVIKTGINGRLKEILAGNGNHEPCGIAKEIKYKKGGIFKYYELEQYEQILRNLVYQDVPDEWIESFKDIENLDCFIFDTKLSTAIDSKGDKFKIDLSKLYENIDLKESIYNHLGKKPIKITDDEVTFGDGTVLPLLQVIKPFLVW